MSKIDTAQWHEFTYDDIFELQTVSTKLTKLDLESNGTVPVYSSDSSNNGKIGYCNKEPHFKVSAECPVYVLFGDHTRTLNIVTEDFCVKDNVKVLIPKIHDINSLLFIITVWKKAIPSLGYARHWSVAKEAPILLPAIEMDEPDWDYMAERIKEMEAERIKEMEAYLAASGLDNTELTDEERALDLSDINTSEWQKFKMVDLFGKSKLGKYHNPDNLVPCSKGYEYICASNLNNGVNKNLSHVSGEGATLTGTNIIAWGKQCPMFTWHPGQCVTSQGMYYVELGDVPEDCVFFIIACLERACRGQYGYNNCLIGSKFDEIEIKLPVIEKDCPDWDYMRLAISKTTKEVISWLENLRKKEQKIAAEVVGGESYLIH